MVKVTSSPGAACSGAAKILNESVGGWVIVACGAVCVAVGSKVGVDSITAGALSVIAVGVTEGSVVGVSVAVSTGDALGVLS